MLAKSVNPARIEENMKIVKLSDEQMAILNGISKNGLTRFVFPPFGKSFGFPDKE